MFITSWLPRSAWTRPPALRASPSRRISEVEHLARVRPAVEQVARLDEVGLPARPLALLVRRPAKRRTLTRLS